MELHKKLKYLSISMIVLSFGILIFCGFIEFTAKEHFRDSAYWLIYLTFGLSLMYFFIFAVLIFAVHPKEFFVQANMGWGFVFGGVSVIALIIGWYKFSSTTIPSLENIGTNPSELVLAAVFISSFLTFFDCIILTPRCAIVVNERWKNFVSGAFKLDAVVTISLIALYICCLLGESHYSGLQNQNIILFSSGGTVLLMMVSTGLFSIDVLCSDIGSPGKLNIFGP